MTETIWRSCSSEELDVQKYAGLATKHSLDQHLAKMASN